MFLDIISEEIMCEGTNMHLIPNLEKSAIKLENRQESALILEKELFKKIPLNTASTRIAFYVSIWLTGICSLDINATPKLHGSHKTESFSFSYPIGRWQPGTANPLHV